MRRSQPASLDALVEVSPVTGEVFNDAQHARRQHVRARAKDDRQFGTQEAEALSHRDAAFQHEGTDLVDDARALRNQPLANAMQRLQVELVGCLGRDELHGWPLHCFRDRFGVVEVVLLPLRIGPHVLCRHQPGVMAESRELAGEVVRTDARLHANQAGRQIGEFALRSGYATNSDAG
jgi:hypothetical protein